MPEKIQNFFRKLKKDDNKFDEFQAKLQGDKKL